MEKEFVREENAKKIRCQIVLYSNSYRYVLSYTNLFITAYELNSKRKRNKRETHIIARTFVHEQQQWMKMKFEMGMKNKRRNMA